MEVILFLPDHLLTICKFLCIGSTYQPGAKNIRFGERTGGYSRVFRNI